MRVLILDEQSTTTETDFQRGTLKNPALPGGVLLDVQVTANQGRRLIQELRAAQPVAAPISFPTAITSKNDSREKRGEVMQMAATHNAAQLRPVPSDGTGRQSARIAIHARGKIRLIAPSEVIAVESEGNYIHMHQLSGTHKIRALMFETERALTQYGFVRVHRSILVNPQHVEELERMPGGRCLVTLTGGHSFPISRGYRKNLRRLLEIRDSGGASTRERRDTPAAWNLPESERFPAFAGRQDVG